jgi:decaprenylphospho-beta-D-erythro-pentofuranosid-2-ulose 2-reductase
MPTVLILGATSDIAVATARVFADKGYDIQLAARNAARLQPLKADLVVRSNVKVELYEFDAVRFNSHETFYHGLTSKPDVCICIFGLLGVNEKAVADWSQAEAILSTNYTGAVSILNIVAEDFISRRNGIIAGVSSVAGERGRQSNYLYGSAKAGFTAYLSGLRNRMFHHQLHVATIQPGFVYTQMTSEMKLPPMLTATPEQVAKAIYGAVTGKKNIVYVKWFWRWIMLIIKLIPEPVFKRLKL